MVPVRAVRPGWFLQKVVLTFLRVNAITKRFGGITANRGITFDVAPGELVGIIGPNGAGKSTLFECISGFYAPDAGEVELEGARLTGLRPTSSAAAASPGPSRSCARSRA
jgi:branched-chain amino acid transport system ATP-binding protein